MRKHPVSFFMVALVIIASFSLTALGQKKPKAKKPVIFAVLNDGGLIEPIAHIERKKLTNTVGGDEPLAKKKAFGAKYYKTDSKYKLIFGGKENGDVRVGRFDPNSECSSNIASVEVGTERTNIKGFVMGLATDLTIKRPGSDVRRLPTRNERIAIEALVRRKFSQNKVSRSRIRRMKYHNLTALDVDGDGRAEQVGSFWVPMGAKERGLLFFIAQRARNGRYYFAHSDFRRVKDSEVMSGEIKALENGIYNELLLDIFDYDQDGVSEIFTYTQGFEGSNFTVYKRRRSVWTKAFSSSNYHCGY